MRNICTEIVSRIPGTKRRTVIEAKFVDKNETLAIVRAGRPESLHEYLSRAIAYTTDEELHPDSIVVFQADTIAAIPLIGDVRLATKRLGTSADGGYRQALALLTQEKPIDI